MANDLVTIDGEVVPAGREIDVSASVSLARAEIDVQIATARAYPRSVAKVIKRITELATLDEETAEECCYALVRRKKGAREQDEDNKAIEGPSIRLAEIAAQAWGNNRSDARVIAVNRQEKYVEAEGVFHDLETNMATRAVVRRNIRTSKGFLFSDDMITVTGNAACSIAKRNAILAGIPRGVYRPAYRAARGIVAGTAETLGANRAKVYRAFASYGVTPAQIHELLGLGGEADVGLDHIALLRATFASIKNNEATVSEIFAKEKPNDGVADPLGTTKAPASKSEAKAEVKPEQSSAEREKAPTQSSPTSDAPARAEPAKAEVSETHPETSAVDPEDSSHLPEESEVMNRAEPSDEIVEAQETKPEVKPAPAKKTKPPTTLTEYRAHVLAYVEAATSAASLDDAWKSERKLRIDVNITSEVMEELKAAVGAKIKELKEQTE